MMQEDKKVSLKPFTLAPTDEIKECKNGVAFDVFIQPQTKPEKIICTRVSHAPINSVILEEKLKSAEKRRTSRLEKQREALMMKKEKINTDLNMHQEKLKQQQLEIRARLEKKMALAEQEALKKKKDLESRGALRDERIRQVNERKAEAKSTESSE